MKNTSFLRKHLLLVVIAVFSVQFLSSQFILDAEVRPRAEYRHGFKTLMPDSVDPAFSISQRTRFNALYNKDKVKLYISLQDVRTWGDVGQLNVSDVNGLAIHQAWGEIGLGDNFAIKAGRQELNYDDARFLGNVAWAQQARSHDALLGKYKNGKWKFHLALAYNQQGQSLTGNVYTIPNNYKAMQYVWANYKAESFKVSLLILNNGLQYQHPVDSDSNETRYSQTYGIHAKTRAADLIDITGNFYFQGGKDRHARSMSAYLIGIDLGFQPDEAKWNVGLGFELQSGNDLDWNSSTATKNNAFTPLYGTNHKFNGFMDYFYVGNHINSVGLVDIYARGGFKTGKSKFLLAIHNFMSNGAMNVGTETESSQLGTEIDLVYAYIFNKTFNVKAGYSQMFASESMGLIKNGNYENTNNWAWVMLTFKPQLLKHEYADKKEL